MVYVLLAIRLTSYQLNTLSSTSAWLWTGWAILLQQYSGPGCMNFWQATRFIYYRDDSLAVILPCLILSETILVP